MDIWLAAKPGELAFGEAARGLLDIGDGGGERDAAFEVGAEVGVADELERLGVGGDTRTFSRALSRTSSRTSEETRVRTSSSQPAASISLTRASMRA